MLVRENLTFGEALEETKSGASMRLPSWQPDVVLKAQYPDKHSKMSVPYLYRQCRFGCVPWRVTDVELFSNEWQTISGDVTCAEIAVEAVNAVTNDDRWLGEPASLHGFNGALSHLKSGGAVKRKGWNGLDLYVEMHKGLDYEHAIIEPFFVLKNSRNSFNTWAPSVSDLVAEDWVLLG